MVRHLPGVVISVSFAAVASASDRSLAHLELTQVVLTIGMAGGCAVSDEARSLAQSESARVWSQAGLRIRWVPVSEVPYAAPPSEWLLVRCRHAVEPQQSSDAPALPVAAIRFVGARPGNTIQLNVENALTLLRRDAPQSLGERRWFIPFREKRLGRMLGRAIAHEIGHFLSQSNAHTRTGLMRPSHSVDALTGPSLAAFRIEHVSQY